MNEKYQENLGLSPTVAYGRHNSNSVEMVWLPPALVHKESGGHRRELVKQLTTAGAKVSFVEDSDLVPFPSELWFFIYKG